MPPFSAALRNSRVLVLSGIEREEIDELREWFCYTKPLGPSIRGPGDHGRRRRRYLCGGGWQ
jgi:hypothetical protein